MSNLRAQNSGYESLLVGHQIAREILPCSLAIDRDNTQDRDDVFSLNIRRDCNGDVTGYQLTVAVSHVSNFVVPGSELFEIARDRCQSVYLQDRVINMLPIELATDYLSLNQDEKPKPVIAAILNFDKFGNLEESRLVPAMSVDRFAINYGKADAILNLLDSSSEVVSEILCGTKTLLLKFLKTDSINSHEIIFAIKFLINWLITNEIMNSSRIAIYRAIPEGIVNLRCARYSYVTTPGSGQGVIQNNLIPANMCVNLVTATAALRRFVDIVNQVVLDSVKGWGNTDNKLTDDEVKQIAKQQTEKRDKIDKWGHKVRKEIEAIKLLNCHESVLFELAPNKLIDILYFIEFNNVDELLRSKFLKVLRCMCERDSLHFIVIKHLIRNWDKENLKIFLLEIMDVAENNPKLKLLTQGFFADSTKSVKEYPIFRANTKLNSGYYKMQAMVKLNSEILIYGELQDGNDQFVVQELAILSLLRNLLANRSADVTEGMKIKRHFEFFHDNYAYLVDRRGAICVDSSLKKTVCREGGKYIVEIVYIEDGVTYTAGVVDLDLHNAIDKAAGIVRGKLLPYWTLKKVSSTEHNNHA